MDLLDRGGIRDVLEECSDILSYLGKNRRKLLRALFGARGRLQSLQFRDAVAELIRRPVDHSPHSKVVGQLRRADFLPVPGLRRCLC